MQRCHLRHFHRAAGTACTAGAAVAAALLSSVAFAQAPGTTMFPFVIPWDDATPGTATDVSWLNDKPAGAGGPIIVRGGHFIEERTGRRVRFLGTNFTFGSDFPTHEDAEKVAAHLAKLGINIVRIHHHDIDSSPLWDKTYGDHRHFDAAALDRLDYLIYQLKRNGIYVDLNLHVSRKLTAADGLPPSADQIALDYDKRVDRFDRTMIARQKEFAHDYLTHVNPYTKESYAVDPCVAIVEINNENSLVDDAATNLAGKLAELPEPFRGELVDLWNGWLLQKYGTDTRLRAAWSGHSTPAGPSLVTARSAWTLEQHPPTAAAIATSDGDSGTPVPAATAPPAHFTVDRVDGTDWHVQAHLAGLNVTEGDSYTVRFQARSDAPRTIGVNVRLDQADWHNIGLDTTAPLTPEWKSYVYTFVAEGSVPGHTRLSFVLGGKTGSVDLRHVSFSPGVPPDLAAQSGTLAARSIELPQGGSRAVRADWVRFLADTERAYAREMQGYLKQDLHVRANLIDTQISWSKSAGPYREASMDFADNHSYWQHPSFPGKPWDMANWTIQNTPQVAALAKGSGSLPELAAYRIAGKPYTISEYNEPAPNDYRCEAVPELAAFAAAQDWDGIFLFDWGSYGAGAANDKVQGFFSTGSDPARAAFLPAAAIIFRSDRAGLPPLSGSVRLDLPESAAVAAVPISSYWTKAAASGATPQGSALTPERLLTMQRSVHLVPGDGAPRLTVTIPAASGSRTDFRVSGDEGDDAALTAAAASAPGGRGALCATAAGYLGGRTIALGRAQIAFGKFGNGFCAATLTAAGKSGKNLLLTLVGRVENRDMGWNANRTSVGKDWGAGPSQAQFVPATVTVPAAPGAKVWTLDGSGRRVREIPASIANGRLTFSTSAEGASLWYEIGS